MKSPRSYVFTGNATGVAFRIRRPADLSLPAQAVSSLPETGGVSESKVGPGRLDKPGSPFPYISFESASSRAEGDYIDSRQSIAMTRGQLAYGGASAYTNVNAEVTGLAVLGRLQVDRAVMALQGQSAEHPSEPPIRCEGTLLEGVRVDGYPLSITLAVDFFCSNDTMSKLGVACGNGEEPQLFFRANHATTYGFSNPGKTVKCTLVREMKWADRPHPDATIEGNTLIIPDFGTVYFAETYITGYSRRLTMVRFQLGSTGTAAARDDSRDSGDGSASSGDSNGGTWPPTAP